MPAIIALILRQVIMSIATGAVVTGAQEVLDGTAKELVKEIKDKEGVTEQDAKDIVGNILIDLGVNSATIFAVLKTGLGVKAAEFLGLTSRGFKKKALTSIAASAAAKITADGGKKVATGAIPKILKIIAIPGSFVWLVKALADIIEPGIYQPAQANAIYAKLGIPFKYPMPKGTEKAGPYTAETFKDLANALEAQRITGFKDIGTGYSIAYSQQALADVVDYIYGKEILAGRVPTAKQLSVLLQPHIISVGGVGGVGGTTVKNVVSGTTTLTTKVFTGIVSQGVVGKGLVFTSRPDDLIENIEELRDAAANNLAPFLATLPGKIVYEVKVVSSIITKDGFKQTGTVQRIQSGTTAGGYPKYKTIVNKFATLVLYAFTDKGTRTKLSTVVLGPVDSAKLRVLQNDLRELEAALPSLVTTSNTDDIKEIVSGTETISTIVETPIVEKYPFTPAGQEAKAKDFNLFMAQNRNGVFPYELQPDPGKNEWYMENGVPLVRAFVSTPTTSVAVNNVITRPQGQGANATTLFEWYQVRGFPLPSVAERAKLYQEAGLGQASYYIGTSEQNTKLLNYFKTYT